MRSRAQLYTRLGPDLQLRYGTSMRKRSIFLLGLTGAVIGAIATELARGFLRARVEQSLRDPRENLALPQPSLRHHAAPRKEADEPWVTPLPEEVSRTTH